MLLQFYAVLLLFVFSSGEFRGDRPASAKQVSHQKFRHLRLYANRSAAGLREPKKEATMATETVVRETFRRSRLKQEVGVERKVYRL